MVWLDLTQIILKQLPVPGIESYERVIKYNGIEATFSTHILSRLHILYSDDDRIADTFSKYDLYKATGSRREVIAEIDQLIGELYGLSEDTVLDIAKSFDAFYSKEEVAAYFG